MRIAFTTNGENWDAKIDARFGRTEFITIYDDETKELSSINNSDLAQMAHGVGPKMAQRIIEKNVQVLITGNGPGDNALRILEKSNIEIYVDAHEFDVKEAYTKYQSNELRKA